ncbi:MAG: DUF308 domain-containing protein [Ruminococcus sp.]|nr:DUF308 domain-containing protein [Ruminococcus sp.]
MTGGRRVTDILVGVLTMLLGFALILFPKHGLSIVAGILSMTMIVYGVRMLIYYCSMARHMVGGRTMLYIAVIVLDLGVFAWTLTDIPKIYIVLYLAVVHAFSGVIDIMRGLEAKKYKAPSWRLSALSGAVNLTVAILCIVFLGSTDMIVYIYSAGLIYSAVTRIITAFRKTAIVYIQ